MYGITKLDLQKIQLKHTKQREYLSNSEFETSNGQIKTLLDVSFSANHSPRYYTELLNKINTLNDLMNSEINVTYKPVFITITLDGFFRDFLYGHFNKYDEKLHKKLIPNNDRFGHLRDKIKQKRNFTIKDLYNVLNHQLNSFNKSQIFKDIKEDGYKIHYIRVAEPHKKDGVPHFHIMMYVPEQYVNRLKDYYVRYFPAPQNIKKLNKDSYDGQLKGFQYEIKSAPAYILKYIFKSFLDVKNKSELDELQAWYIKNRILRIVTSHSIVPAWVYRKMIPIEKDWYYLTDIKKYCTCEWSKEDDYISFTDSTNRTLEYKQGVYKIYYDDKIIKEFGTQKEQKTESLKQTIKLKYKKRIKEPKIFIDKKEYTMKDNKLEPVYRIVPIKYRTNYILYNQYRKLTSFNLLDVDMREFALINNELVNRNYIKADLIPTNINFKYSKNF